MSLEEAVQWCIDHEVDVSFSVTDGRVFVHIYQDMTSDFFDQLSEGDTLIGAVLAAKERASE